MAVELPYPKINKLVRELAVMKKLFYIVGKKYSGKSEVYSRIISERKLEPFKYLVVTDSKSKELDEFDGITEEELKRLKKLGKITSCTDEKYWILKESNKDYYLGVGDMDSLRELQKSYGSDIVIPIYIHSDDRHRELRALKSGLDINELHKDDWKYSKENMIQNKVYMYFENNNNLWDCIYAIKTLINSKTRD